MSVLVKIKLLRGQPPYNAGETASVSPERLATFAKDSYIIIVPKKAASAKKIAQSKKKEGK